jgi:peptidoglycan/xylan/chitin deacetylase (PgdA/CDA1 family)
MKIIVYAVVLLLNCAAFGQRKEVSVTIDDLPVAGGNAGDIYYQRAVTSHLLSALVRHNVPAIGFVNAKKLYTNDTLDSRKTALLEEWLAEGMDLGNHSYSHKEYNVVPFSEFSADIIQGESPVREILAAHGKPLHYFRHPFLHRGDSKAKAESLQTFLRERGYEEAPVTIDNGDWIFAAAYYTAFAAHDSLQMTTIGTSYIGYMEKKLRYYEIQSLAVCGHAIKQILLIHASRLNADYFDALASMFEKNGYTFVPLARALTDSAYRLPDAFYRKGGISWIDRWALTQGRTGGFFKDEPRVPEFIMKLAHVDSE